MLIEGGSDWSFDCESISLEKFPCLSAFTEFIEEFMLESLNNESFVFLALNNGLLLLALLIFLVIFSFSSILGFLRDFFGFSLKGPGAGNWGGSSLTCGLNFKRELVLFGSMKLNEVMNSNIRIPGLRTVT